MSTLARNASKSLVTLACTAALTFTMAQPANATSAVPVTAGAVAAPAVAPIGLEISESQFDAGSLADRISQATTFEEASSILEQEGFAQAHNQPDESVVAYEKTVDGATIGFSLTAPGSIQPLWGGGFNVFQGGPYVKGTISEWQSLITSGIIVGGAGCTFITATIGAAACVAAAGLAQQYISQNGGSLPAGQCLAIAPFPFSTSWVESC